MGAVWVTLVVLKVLGTQRLMHISYDEFEKVMVAAFEVFASWDDEYEKLQVSSTNIELSCESVRTIVQQPTRSDALAKQRTRFWNLSTAKLTHEKQWASNNDSSRAALSVYGRQCIVISKPCNACLCKISWRRVKYPACSKRNSFHNVWERIIFNCPENCGKISI